MDARRQPGAGLARRVLVLALPIACSLDTQGQASSLPDSSVVDAADGSFFDASGGFAAHSSTGGSGTPADTGAGGAESGASGTAGASGHAVDAAPTCIALGEGGCTQAKQCCEFEPDADPAILCSKDALCCMPVGGTCHQQGQCCGRGTCENGTCCLPLGTACTSAGACCGATPSATPVMCGSPAKVCCTTVQSPCTLPGDCCSGMCKDGSCACLYVGAACANRWECCSNNCEHGVCCRPKGRACATPEECCSGACAAGACQ